MIRGLFVPPTNQWAASRTVQRGVCHKREGNCLPSARWPASAASPFAFVARYIGLILTLPVFDI